MSTAPAQTVPEAIHSRPSASSHAAWNRPAGGAVRESAQPETREAAYARAARQMHRGKMLVITGFALLFLGMIGYCVISLGTAPNQSVGLNILANSSWLLTPAQAVMAAGTLLWLVGSFVYFLGGLDSDPEGPDLYF